MSKREEFQDQIRETKRKIEELEDFLDDLYFRLDETE